MTDHNNLIINLKESPDNFPLFFKKIYDRNCIKKKKIYLCWIDEISKKYKFNIYWWSLAHVNKNNYLNKTYHLFVLLETIKDLKNSKKFNTIVIDEALKKNILKINFKFKKKIVTFKKKDISFNYFQITKFFFFNFLLILFFKFFSKKKFYRNNLTLVDCFIYDYNYPEFGFIENIKKNVKIKENFFFVPTFAYIGYLKRFFLTAKLFKKKNYLFREQFLNIKDLFEIIKIIKYAKSFKDQVDKINNWDFSKIIFREMKNFSQFESIIFSVLNFKFVGNLKNENIDVYKSINYFENQNLDKGWNLGFNTYYKNRKNIGYQAFNYLPESFNISPSEEEFQQNICPKKIITKGKGFAKIIGENCKKIAFLTGPSFKSFDKKKFSLKKKIDYLFLLTGVPNEDKKIVDQILLFQKKNKKQTIGIKPHPITKLSNHYDKKLKEINVKIFKGDISKSLQLSKTVICTGLTTSLIEALIYNCTIIMNSNSIFDKFFFKKLNIPRKAYLFTDNINQKKNLNLNPLKSFEKSKIIDNYFSNLSRKNIKNLI